MSAKKQEPATGATLAMNFETGEHAYKDAAGQLATGNNDGVDDALEAFARFQAHNVEFDIRGIHRKIREERPYIYWTPEEPEALQEAWFRFVKPSLKGWVTRCARQTPGYVITRHEPPGIGAPEVCAEIKPLKAIETEPGNFAKYVFPPGPGLAARIDVHPLALEYFHAAERVFFGIEGCLKADAMLTEGEAVASVPSVSLWNAPELPAFARKYLKGKTVFIVPDADWHDNWMVKSQAIQCQCHLLALGVENVFVAAPPREAGLKGVDDFLAAGFKLDEMVVIGREMPAAFKAWAIREARDTRITGAARDAELLQALSMCAGMTEDQGGEKIEREGEIYRAVRPVQRVISAVNPRREKPMDRKNIREAFDSLAQRPGWRSETAISISGSLDVEDGEQKLRGGYLPDGEDEHGVAPVEGGNGWSYFKQSDWKDRPRITVAPELRAEDRDPVQVGDLMATLVHSKIEPFLAVDVSVERLRVLRSEAASPS